MHFQEWGAGEPLIALHPLALESSAFAGLAGDLARQGIRTLGADLPGFGLTPAPEGARLTPALLAEPVVALARSLEMPPLLLGFSMGGRVALEAALAEPTAFRGVILVAPYLPWRRYRRMMSTAERIRPSEWASQIPLERAWPLLKRVAESIESIPRLSDDWFARACVRVIYYSSCSATREAFLSAARELALDPAFGTTGLWTRLPELPLPAAFVWAGRDGLIPSDHAMHVREALPHAHALEVPCSGHFVNQGHHRCLERAMASAVASVVDDATRRPARRGSVALAPCVSGSEEVASSRAEEATGAQGSSTGSPPMSAETEAPLGEAASGFRRLTGADAIFLYAETPSMLMHTMGTTILDPSGVPGGFGWEELVRTVASRIHCMPPFRQRLLETPLGLGHPVLVDDPDFRLENHLHRVAVPAPGTMRDLAEIVADIAGRALPRTQPLWEMTLIEGLEGGRLALIAKLHHCTMDGASGASQMAHLMDLQPDAEPPSTAAKWNPPPLPSSLELARRSVGSNIAGPLTVARLLYQTAQGVRSRRRAQLETLGEGESAPPLMGGAPRTHFNGAITAHRSVAYASAPLDEIKRIKNAFEVTLNDAVLAAASLALRRYLLARDDLPEEPLVATVPVSTKSDAEKSDLGVGVSGMGVSLPTHLEDPEAVIRAVHRETSDAKHVYAAVEHDIIPQWLELAPPALISATTRLYSDWDLADDQEMRPMNLAVSNMRGPPVPLYFGGARVEAVYPMGPVAEGMGLNLTLLSNMGRLDVGVLACRESVDDVWEIADGFVQAVGDLAIAAEKQRPS